MNIIKSAAAVLTALSMTTGVCAQVSLHIQPTVFLTDTVGLIGETGVAGKQQLNIIVSKEGVELKNITNGVDLFKQQNEIWTDENGNFSFSFKMKCHEGEYDSEKRSWGEYGVYIKSESMKEPMYKTLCYSGETDRKKAIAEINAGTQHDVLEKADEYAKIFGLGDFEALSMADKADVAERLKKTQYTDADSQKIQDIMKESAILSCYNNGEILAAADENYNLKYTDLIGYDSFDSDYTSTLYECYNTLLSNDGKKLVLEKIALSKPTDYDSLKRAFAKNVVLCGIKNSAQGGGEHIGKLLTRDNAKLIGLSAENYFASDMKNKIHSELLKENGFSSVSELEEKLNKIIKALPPKETTGGGSSSGKTSFSGPASSIAAEVNNGGNESAFADMDNGHWAKSAVEELHKRGIVSGYPDNTFRPDEKVTREQALKMILCAMEYEPVRYSGSFFDVDKSAWYADYVGAALQKNIVKGMGENMFGIGKNITREDFAVLLYRTVGSPECGERCGFADKADVSDYAVSAVDYMSFMKYISGYKDGSFKPKKTITRAETAMVIYKLLGGEGV